MEPRQYRTKLEMPDFDSSYPWGRGEAAREFVDMISAVGWVKPVGHGFAGQVPEAGKQFFIYLEAQDLYELGMKVRDLEDELSAAFGGMSFELRRPTLVDKRDRIERHLR